MCGAELTHNARRFLLIAPPGPIPRDGQPVKLKCVIGTSSSQPVAAGTPQPTFLRVALDPCGESGCTTRRPCVIVNLSPSAIAGFWKIVRRRALSWRRADELAEMRPSTSRVLVLNRCSRPVRAAKFALPAHGMVEMGLIEKYGPVPYRSCLARMVLDPS